MTYGNTLQLKVIRATTFNQMTTKEKKLPVGSLEFESHRFECLLELVRGRVLEGHLDLRRVALAGRGHDAGVRKGLACPRQRFNPGKVQVVFGEKCIRHHG